MNNKKGIVTFELLIEQCDIDVLTRISSCNILWHFDHKRNTFESNCIPTGNLSMNMVVNNYLT